MERLDKYRRIALSVGFVAFLISAPISYMFVQRMETSFWEPAPTWDTAAAFRGGIFPPLESHLQESCFWTVQIRGLYAESMYRMGVLDANRVIVGEEEWMCLRNVRVPWDRIDADDIKAKRRHFLQLVRDKYKALGVKLIVALAPDKVSIYPERFESATGPLGDRARLYDYIRDEVRGQGIACVDIRKDLLSAKERFPKTRLFRMRDTHWSHHGSMHAAIAVGRALQLKGWDLGGTADLKIDHIVDAPGLGDLARLLGIRESSSLAARLQEPIGRGRLRYKDGRPFEDEHPDAAVLLCGTSFSGENFGETLAYVLQRPIDRRCVMGGEGPFAGIRRAVRLIESGDARPRVVIWEFVERMYLASWIEAVPTSLD